MSDAVPAIVLRNKTNPSRYLAACADVGDWEDENLDVTMENIKNAYLIIRKDLEVPTLDDFEEHKEWHRKLLSVLTEKFGPDPFVELDFEEACKHYEPVNIEITQEQYIHAKQLMEGLAAKTTARINNDDLADLETLDAELRRLREADGRYTIRRDEAGYAAVIERDGYTVLHLQPGTERNEQEVQGIVNQLNKTDIAKDIAESYDIELRTLVGKLLEANDYYAADAVEKLADQMKSQCSEALSPSGEQEDDSPEPSSRATRKYVIKIGDEYMRERHGADCFTDDLGHAILFDNREQAERELIGANERVVEILEDEEGGLLDGDPDAQ